MAFVSLAFGVLALVFLAAGVGVSPFEALVLSLSDFVFGVFAGYVRVNDVFVEHDS